MIGIAFPGQGAQKVGMVDQIASEQRHYFKMASDLLGYDLWELCQSGSQEQLSLTQFAQPALLVTGIALWESVKSNYQVDFFAGHSLGEITALVAAEAISFADGVQIVAKRGEIMASCNVAGGMAAVIGLEQDQVLEICADPKLEGELTLANYNSPGQYVISGTNSALKYGEELAIAAGARRVIPLAVSGPFHSQLMSSASEQFNQYLIQFNFNNPIKPVISNIDSRLITLGEDIQQELVQQLTKPVRWIDNMLELVRLGVTDLYEVGPGNTLVGLTKRITKDMALHAI